MNMRRSAQIMYFNSQPHKEADPPETSLPELFWYFNSQPHKEADRYSKHARAK